MSDPGKFFVLSLDLLMLVGETVKLLWFMHCIARRRFELSSSHSWGYFAGACVRGPGVGNSFPADIGAVGGVYQYLKKRSLSSPMANEKLGLPQLFHAFHLKTFLFWAHRRVDGSTSWLCSPVAGPAAMPLRALQLSAVCAICLWKLPQNHRHSSITSLSALQGELEGYGAFQCQNGKYPLSPQSCLHQQQPQNIRLPWATACFTHAAGAAVFANLYLAINNDVRPDLSEDRNSKLLEAT